jgi:hypothetical protein
MVRSIVAVVTGFVLIAVLSIGTNVVLARAAPELYPESGIVTHTGALVLALLYVAVYATAGCYLTARLAPSRPMRHALVLGGLGLLFNMAGVVATWGQVPAWYSLTGLALTMPYAWLGGRLRERQLAVQGHGRVAAAN